MPKIALPDSATAVTAAPSGSIYCAGGNSLSVLSPVDNSVPDVKTLPNAG